MPRDFPPRLRRVVFVSKAPLRLRLDIQCVGLRAIGAALAIAAASAVRRDPARQCPTEGTLGRGDSFACARLAWREAAAPPVVPSPKPVGGWGPLA